MNLQTVRLFCSRPTCDDVNSVYQVYSDPRTTQFSPLPAINSIAQAVAMIDAWDKHWVTQQFGTWCIALKDCPAQVIGFGGISIRDFSGQQLPNLWYRFNPMAWGNGYATEFSKAVVEHVVAAVGLKEIHALVKPDHTSSIRVLEKIGMTLNGLTPIPESNESSLRYLLKLD